MTLTPDMDRSLLCWALQPNLRIDASLIAPTHPPRRSRLDSETHRRMPPFYRQQAGSTTTLPVNNIVFGHISRMAAFQLLSWWRRAKMSLDFNKGD